jgi:hypothetical protein
MNHVTVYGSFGGQLGYHEVSEQVIRDALTAKAETDPGLKSSTNDTPPEHLGLLWIVAGMPAPDGKPFDDTGAKGCTVTTCVCGHSRALHVPFGGCTGARNCACGATDRQPCIMVGWPGRPVVHHFG